jgi:hypothetical protein
MPAHRPRRPTPDPEQYLSARIAELEQRIVLLEARVRQVAALAESRGKGKPGDKPPRAARPRPRCPGCRLELPKGRRGESCVWCGFYFEALQSRAMK